MSPPVSSLILQAFEGTNASVPVWFMRQAGRYLPEYQAIKKKYSLSEMFTTSALASEITCLPVDILHVDAAILFADILTLPAHMGFDIHFHDENGPVVKQLNNFKEIHDFDLRGLKYLGETIKLINQRLPKHIPLIGFAGSPFTVLTYLLEGGSSTTYRKTFNLAAAHSDLFHHLMKILTKNTIDYLNLQKEAGIKIFQLFDSGAGILRASDYAHWVLPYVQEIFDAVDLPSIYFVRFAHHLLPLIDRSRADVLSVDHTVILGHDTTLAKTKKGIQGNLCNAYLYADYPTLETEVRDVLLGGQKHGRFIFNLSHGVFPDTDVEKLKFIVQKVHEFSWKRLE